ncbi:MAG: DUF3604 domain-containing protein [Alphaproteobacteria bacterium]|nr:DUF3604 domain-containing protein [Alphaproteobacteria bacterium]
MSRLGPLTAALAVTTALGAGVLAITQSGPFAPAEASASLGLPEYLAPELRAKVERLKADVAAAPTSGTNVEDRIWVFWDWVNAYALQGWPIHPELTSTVSRITQPAGVAGRTSPRLQPSYEAVDMWVREMSLREENPKAIGPLTSPHVGPFEIFSYQTLEQVYTVGERPLVPGDGFLVATRMYGALYDLQRDDPKADNYLSIRSSNPQVKFANETLQVSGMFSGQLGGNNPRPFFRITEGTLAPGDTVTIVMGDKAAGSKGLKMPGTQSTGLRYRVWLQLAEENILFDLPEIPFETVGATTAGVRGFVPSIAARGEPFTLAVRAEDAYRNRATSGMPAWTVRLGDTVIAEIPAGGEAITEIEGVTLSEPGAYQFDIVSADGKIRGKTNAVLVEDAPASRIYWGETHGHSGFAEGMGTVDGYYTFGRDDARLDFLTMSEHDLWMDDYEWEQLRAATKRYYEDGKYITFLGHEWTVSADDGGHHNILFRTPDGRKRVARQVYPTKAEMQAGVRELHDPNDVVVIPHAHNPGNWWNSDTEIERFVEIVSNHGTFEWLGRAFLAEGAQIGFLGGSDDHIGHPGLRPVRESPGSDNFGGLAAIYAPEKTGDAIFDSIRARSGYATNGMRIVLRANLNGSSMGERAASAEARTLEAHVVGSAPIEEIVIVKNGREVKTFDYTAAPFAQARQLELRFWSDTDAPDRESTSRSWRRWAGTVALEGARVSAAYAPKNENVLTESAGLEDGAVAFSLRTRGAYKGVVMDVDGLTQAGKVTVTTRGQGNFTHTFNLADLVEDGEETFVSPIDDYKDTVTLRTIALPSAIEQRISWTDDGTARDGDVYFIRVLQTDGGIAWSSPFWVGGTSAER